MAYQKIDDRSTPGSINDRNRRNPFQDDEVDRSQGASVLFHDDVDQAERRMSLSQPLTTPAATNGGSLPSSASSNYRIYDEPADPYYVFRDDLHRQLESMDEAFAEYLRVIHQTDSSVNTYDVKDIKKQLKRCIKNAESTLNDIIMTIQVVENDRSKFHHINDHELYERNALVSTSTSRINRTKSEMNSDAIKAKLLADERSKALRRATNTSSNPSHPLDSANYPVDNEDTTTNHNHVDSSHGRTSLLLQHQDETLDVLGAAVTRVGHIAESINDEIGQQNKMLTELDNDLSNVEEELGLVMGKLARLLQTKDSYQLGTIACLIGTVFILFLLVLYT